MIITATVGTSVCDPLSLPPPIKLHVRVEWPQARLNVDSCLFPGASANPITPTFVPLNSDEMDAFFNFLSKTYNPRCCQSENEKEWKWACWFPVTVPPATGQIRIFISVIFLSAQYESTTLERSVENGWQSWRTERWESGCNMIRLRRGGEERTVKWKEQTKHQTEGQVLPGQLSQSPVYRYLCKQLLCTRPDNAEVTHKNNKLQISWGGFY